ncbi:MAG: hypothetical protein LBG76_00220 [Treponema sp.]|jgi:hypothetical protein|nr:hypothetical protein [Treponema sp.]
MNNTWRNGKIQKLIIAVYVILSIPPVLYVSYKMIGKIKIATENRNGDFILADETGGGGGGKSL